MANTLPAFELFSIGFGGANLPMRELQSNLVIGLTPEWVVKQRSAPAAYPLGATPHLSVVFQASNIDVFPDGKAFVIEAKGKGVKVPARTVSLDMFPGKPMSEPLVFPMSRIKGGIGIRNITLEWTATDHDGNQFAIGTSSHTIYVTWRAPVSTLPPFESLVRTAVDAAAGQNSLKSISEKLLESIATLGIARADTGGTVRMALLLKSTDSSGFSLILIQMLAAHGITAVLRAFYIDWSKLPTTALQWVPTTEPFPPTPLGPEHHYIALIPDGKAVMLFDPDSGLGPIALPIPLFPDKEWELSGPVFEKMLKKYLEPAEIRRRMLPLPKKPNAVPVTVFSVHFAFPGSNAIVLRDVRSDAQIGQTPEWVAGGDSFVALNATPNGTELGPPPAAFVRGSTITIKVTFLREVDAHDGGAGNISLTIGATGTLANVTEQAVQLTFDPDGRSDEHQFTLDRVIANDVGAATLTLNWYVKPGSGADLPIGDSAHPLFFTWKPMLPNPDKLPTWAYAQVVRWTCRFAAGATSDREVCDLIFKNLESTGLKYGLPGWSPRQMILLGGGMCGGWYQLFQSMVYSQGVFVERTAFLVVWRSMTGIDVQWNAIVVSNGGINQKTPPVLPTEFHDVATFPIPSSINVKKATEPRYRFWGNPDSAKSDGHAINFLVVTSSELVLYDPSYLIGPIPLSMPLPKRDDVLGGAQLAVFVADYLTRAVSHMLGSFMVNGKPMVTEVPVGAAAGVNGVSVETSMLPTDVNGIPTITFRWM